MVFQTGLQRFPFSHAIRANVGVFGSDVGERDRNAILGWSSLKQKIH